MALHKVGNLASQMAKASRGFHTTPERRFIFKGLFKLFDAKKPLLSDEALAVGFEQHENRLKQLPGDPLNAININDSYQPEGKGTKYDPFLIPCHEKERLCKVDLGDEDFDLPEFVVTLENGGRCPITGAHYKLDYHPEWAVMDVHV